MALEYMGTVGNHFVDIHVGLCARPGLPDDQRELVGQLACKYFIAYLCNEVTLFYRQYARVRIGERSRFLKVSKRLDDFFGHGGRRTYFEIVRSEEHTSELQSLMRISYAV